MNSVYLILKFYKKIDFKKRNCCTKFIYLQYIINICIICYIFNKYKYIMESKEDKFKRLANARVNNAIKQLDLIGNLSNSSSYDYTDDEVRKIMSTLNQKVKEVSFKFQESLKKEKFKL